MISKPIQKYHRYLLAVLSGLLLTASFPKIGWSFLAWIAFIPFFAAIQGEKPGRAFWIGFVAGLSHYVTLIYWIAGVCHTYGRLPMVLSIGLMLLLSGYLSLYTALMAFLANRFRERSIGYAISAPILLPALEWTGAFFPCGFPWENLGYSQFQQITLCQGADLFGVYGLSALIIAVNASIFSLANQYRKERKIKWRQPVVLIIIVAAFLGYGTWRVKKIDRIAGTETHKNVTLIQGNIDQVVKWDPAFQKQTTRQYIELTHSAQSPDTDLTIWPETALPFYFLREEPLTTMVMENIKAMKGWLLTGSPSYVWKNDKPSYRNSAYLIAPGGKIAGKYDKVRLVPFGEYVPLGDWFPFIGKIVEAVGDFSSGEKGHVLQWDDTRIGVLICFEVIFPELARKLAENGATLFVTITNDAWFGRSSAPYQHLSMAVFRAVENRVAIARSANTGISAFIDPVGRITHQTPLFQAATLSAQIPLMYQRTFYSRFGYIFPMVCVFVTLCGIWRKKQPLEPKPL
jgi:apolipoprotein N-acyltransferase